MFQYTDCVCYKEYLQTFTVVRRTGTDKVTCAACYDTRNSIFVSVPFNNVVSC